MTSQKKAEQPPSCAHIVPQQCGRGMFTSPVTRQCNTDVSPTGTQHMQIPEDHYQALEEPPEDI